MLQLTSDTHLTPGYDTTQKLLRPSYQNLADGCFYFNRHITVAITNLFMDCCHAWDRKETVADAMSRGQPACQEEWKMCRKKRKVIVRDSARFKYKLMGFMVYF
jgi:hypothetical protein